MITKIRLQNWKSFKDSTIYIDSLGILIGPMLVVSQIC